MQIRQTVPADMPAVLGVHREAFGGDIEAGLVERLSSDSCFIPELSLVAEEGGEVWGHVLLTRAQVECDGGECVDVLALAPLGVAPDMQGFGVGRALVDRALEIARDAGERGVIVLGQPKYYARFGFVPASSFGIQPPHPVPDAAWMALELCDGSLSGVCGMVGYAEPLREPELW